MMQMTLARFDPLATCAEDLSESHYRDVHVRLAVELLGSVPSIQQYSTYLVRRQYDATGRWNKQPTAWRFALKTTASTASSKLPTTTGS